MTETADLNFDLVVSADDAGFVARIVSAPGGGGTWRFKSPLQPIEVEHVRLLVMRSRAITRSLDNSTATMVRGVGERLFTAAFGGDILTSYVASTRMAAGQNARLRLRLHLEDSQAAQLPWEYLRDPREGGKWLALDDDTPIVRYLAVTTPPRPLKVTGPLRILAVISTPSDRDALDADREYADLRRAVEGLGNRVEVRRLGDPSFAALDRELSRTEYHVLHFVGHGGYDERANEGVLAFTEANGTERRISADQLGPILGGSATLRLAVLNACDGAVAQGKDLFSGVAQKLVAHGIPAVVAMQAEITDRAALDFSARFYETLALGQPVDQALVSARKAIFAQPNELEWATPVLYMRSPDGRLFDVSDQVVPHVAAEPRPLQAATSARPRHVPRVAAIAGAVLALAAIAGSAGDTPVAPAREVETVTAVAPDVAAARVVAEFYQHVNAKEYYAAWLLMSDELRSRLPLYDLEDGYRTTVSTRFEPSNVTIEGGAAVRVDGAIVAVDQTPTGRVNGLFRGSYYVRNLGGRWYIDGGRFDRIQ